MMKHLYILLLALGATAMDAQNDNSFGNGLTNIGSLNNAPVSQAQSNPLDNQAFKQVSLKQVLLDNKAGNDMPQQQQAVSENNVSGPLQQASVNQSKNTANKGGSFPLPKPSVNFGGGASRSSGKSHSQHFSKKMKKLNRRMTYVFAKKHKRSYTVDFCFAWAR